MAQDQDLDLLALTLAAEQHQQFEDPVERHVQEGKHAAPPVAGQEGQQATPARLDYVSPQPALGERRLIEFMHPMGVSRLPVHPPDCQDSQNRYRSRVPWIGDAESLLGEGPEESDAAPRFR